jgi:hypothetical protein
MQLMACGMAALGLADRQPECPTRGVSGLAGYGGERTFCDRNLDVDHNHA